MKVRCAGCDHDHPQGQGCDIGRCDCSWTDDPNPWPAEEIVWDHRPITPGTADMIRRCKAAGTPGLIALQLLPSDMPEPTPALNGQLNLRVP